LEVSVFNKGDRVKLNEYGLDSLFPSVASKGLRDMAAKAVFVVLGHIQHNRFTRVMVEGGSSNTAFSYSPTFLQAAEGGKLRKGQVITIYEDPLTETKPEGKAQLISPIDQSVPDAMERWLVQFLDDDFHSPVERLIKVR
jgi:hypothetical protein